MNKDILAGFYATDFSKFCGKDVFPDDSKYAEVTPVHKSRLKSDKACKNCKYTSKYFQNK